MLLTKTKPTSAFKLATIHQMRSHFLATIIIALCLFAGCKDKDEPTYEKIKLFFVAHGWDSEEFPDNGVQVYVDNVLIGTISKPVDMEDLEFLNQNFNENTDTSSAYGILYIMEKETINYDFAFSNGMTASTKGCPHVSFMGCKYALISQQ